MIASMARRHRRRMMAGTIIVIAVVLLHPWPRAGIGRIRSLVKWPEDCASVETVSPFANPDTRRWKDAETTAIVRCNNIGPAVAYADFPTTADLRSDLSAFPPSSRVCTYGRSVAIDYLDHRRDFVRLCGSLHGSLD